MSRHYWRKGGHEHLALARHMFDRQAESFGSTPENADAAWQEKDIAQFWLDESWAALVFIHKKMKETGDELAGDEREDDVPLTGEWKVPHLCADSIHDFRFDSAMDVTYCGKCDYWSPGDE